MYDHLGLKVRDLDASVRFYAQALAPLGHVVCSHDASGAGLGPKGAAALWLSPSASVAPTGMHIAFKADARSQVDRFHAAGIKAGGRDNGTPGLRSDYGPSYYAAFLIDLDGNNVEAVCLRE